MNDMLFIISAAAAIVSALGVVLGRHGLQCVLWMFALLIALSGVMVAMGAYFLALMTVLVYAGAILVLFAFVVMFMGQGAGQRTVGRWRLMWALLAVALALGLALPLCPMVASSWGFPADNTLNRTALYGPELFARYQLPTQLAAWLLLWVAVGAFNVLGVPRKEVS